MNKSRDTSTSLVLNTKGPVLEKKWPSFSSGIREVLFGVLGRMSLWNLLTASHLTIVYVFDSVTVFLIEK